MPEKIALAYHEAAHAVACVLLGVFVNEVAIVPHGNLLGYCRSALYDLTDVRGDEWLAGRPPRGVRRQIAQSMIGLAAGPMADGIFSARQCAADGDCFERAVYYADNYGPDSDLAPLLDLCLLLDPQGRFLERRLRRVRQFAFRLLCSHWPAVEAVAAELVSRQRLLGGQVRLIVARAGK